jgi:hypothetical protein
MVKPVRASRVCYQERVLSWPSTTFDGGVAWTAGTGSVAAAAGSSSVRAIAQDT